MPDVSLDIKCYHDSGDEYIISWQVGLHTYNRGVVRSPANIKNGNLCNNSTWLKAVNHSYKTLHLRYLCGVLATPLLYKRQIFKSGLSKSCGRHPLKIWRDVFCLSRPHLFKFFNGCLPQNLLRPLLNTLSHITCVKLAKTTLAQLQSQW